MALEPRRRVVRTRLSGRRCPDGCLFLQGAAALFEPVAGGRGLLRERQRARTGLGGRFEERLRRMASG
jgi:hypothetical protein